MASIEISNSYDNTNKALNMMMGNFNNMITCGEWTAIRYDISNTNRRTDETYPGSVMEFVYFKDYGEELGARIAERWAAVYFRTRIQDKAAGTVEAGSEMKFLHFAPDGDGVKVVECWAK